jgi:hypothetical protein
MTFRYCKILRSNSTPNSSGATAKFPALRSTEKQSTLLSEFVSFVQRNAPGEVVDGLQLPMCDDADLKIITSDLCHPHKLQLDDDEVIWNDLVSILVNEKAWRDARRSDRDNALVNLRAATPQVASRNQYLAAAGETILVHVSLHNPLQVEIQLTELQVIAEYVGEVSEQDQPVQLASVSMTLSPMETNMLQLSIVPPRAGLLAIRGVHWRLQNAIHCRHIFEFPCNLFPPKECLFDRGAICFVISPPQPLVEAKIIDLPSTMYHGEVCEGVLEIWNKGTVDACNVRVQFSHPSCIVPLKSAADLRRTFIPAVSSRITDSCPSAALSSLDIDGVYTHALSAPVSPGACVRVHFLMHANGTDQSVMFDDSYSLDIKCGIMYTSPVPSPAVHGKSIRFRMLRLSCHTKVDRILDASITCRRSALSADSNIAAVQLLAHAPCNVTQISCLSGFWTASPLRSQQSALHSTASPEGLKLEPENNCNLVFRFVPPQPSLNSSPGAKDVLQTVFNLRDSAVIGVSDLLAGPLLLLYSRRNAESGSTSVAAAHRLAELATQVIFFVCCTREKSFAFSRMTSFWAHPQCLPPMLKPVSFGLRLTGS